MASIKAATGLPVVEVFERLQHKELYKCGNPVSEFKPVDLSAVSGTPDEMEEICMENFSVLQFNSFPQCLGAGFFGLGATSLLVFAVAYRRFHEIHRSNQAHSGYFNLL